MCFLQVVVVFCLWGTDVSRAYVFQASGPSEGGDNPQPHTKGKKPSGQKTTHDAPFKIWLVIK